jgi:hypothetical protein
MREESFYSPFLGGDSRVVIKIHAIFAFYFALTFLYIQEAFDWELMYLGMIPIKSRNLFQIIMRVQHNHITELYMVRLYRFQHSSTEPLKTRGLPRELSNRKND